LLDWRDCGTMTGMRDIQHESLSHDPVHGYIPFISTVNRDREVAERDLIDHPWIQRLRQIHQLQTAWWVYPTAEHTRFQHVIGSMHLASRATETLYESLKNVVPDVPSRGYVECLMRMAALLHDVGHGPFGHFLDEHFLRHHGLTHETLGAAIITRELADMLRGIRRNPNSCMEEGEQLDPEQIAFLITRPRLEDEQHGWPRWLHMLRSLFCGIYTVDNLDFVLRDAFMSGYSSQAYDLERLLRYSFFSSAGLTIHRRGIDALVRFIRVRSELFRAIYFHRTVRAIDLTLSDLFAESKPYLFEGNPLENLEAYRGFTEWSLLIDVSRWHKSDDPHKSALGRRWQDFLARKVQWITACERNLVFIAADSESASIFSDPEMVEARLRKRLPDRFADWPLRIDLPRHIHRPNALAASSGQNFLFNPAHNRTRPLTDDQVFRTLPLSQRICRVYAQKDADPAFSAAISDALDELIGPAASDDLTNM